MTTTIQILGTGCPKCRKLTQNVEAVVRDAGAEYTIEKVTDINEIVKSGVMMTPALVVDGEVKCAGKIPSIEDIRKLLG